MVWPPPDILPFWVWLAFSLFLYTLSLPFRLLHFHVTVILFLQFCFLYYLPISSPFPSFPLFFVSFNALPVLLRHFSSSPSLPQFKTERLHPPLNFSVTEVSIVLISLIPTIFPLSFDAHYYVPWSPGPACGNLPWSSIGQQNLAPPFFFFTIYYRLYWFLLICSLF